MNTVALQSLALVSQLGVVGLVSQQGGAEALGKYALLLTSGQLAAVVASCGFATATPYLLAGRREHANALAKNALVCSALLSCLILLGSHGLYRLGFGPASLAHTGMWIGYGFGLSLNLFFSRLAISLGRVVVSGLINAAPPAGTLLCGLGALALDYRLSPVTIFHFGTLFQLGICAIAAVALLEWKQMNRLALGKVGLREHFRVAKLGFASTGLAMLANRVDLFLIDSMIGLGAVGVYSLAVQLAEVATRIPNWLSSLIAPRAAEDPKGSSRFTALLTLLNALLALCVCVSLVGLGLFLGDFHWTMGLRLEEVTHLVAALTPKSVLLVSASTLGAYLIGRGISLYHPVTAGLTVLATAVLDVLLLPRWGLMGAAFAVSVSHVILFAGLLLGFARMTETTISQIIRLALNDLSSIWDKAVARMRSGQNF